MDVDSVAHHEVHTQLSPGQHEPQPPQQRQRQQQKQQRPAPHWKPQKRIISTPIAGTGIFVLVEEKAPKIPLLSGTCPNVCASFASTDRYRRGLTDATNPITRQASPGNGPRTWSCRPPTRT